MAVAPAARVAVPHAPERHSPGTSPTQPTISVVIPAKNEAENLPIVLPRIPALVDEVILVDGLSTDQTVAVAKMVRSDLTVVHETRPGKGAALRAGFAAARGDFIVMMDADCSMEPLEITSFVELLNDGYDMVKGSRFMLGGGTDDMTPLRKAGNWGLLKLANTLYRSNHTDLLYGFLAFRRELLDVVDLDADGFEVEMQFVARALRAGAKVGEVPSYEARRQYGQSNLRTFRDGWRVLLTLLRELAWRPAAQARAQARG